MTRIITYIGLGVLASLCLMANNLQITNFTVNQSNQTVSFQVSWNNAWRFTSTPNNWDAVWIFVKFRQCNSFDDPWTHGVISTTLSDHSIPAALEAIRSDGSAVGVDPAPNNLGIMLRPAVADTYSTFGPHAVTLKVTNLPTSGQYDFRIFGIEMVFIPQGAYKLGTLYGNHWTHGAAFDTTGNHWGDPHVAYNITSENAILLKWSGNSTGINVPAAFPKGFKAFHVMKYEISQGQYAAFLNTLPSSAAAARYPGNFNSHRNRLINTGVYPNQYYSDREDRAQNFLSWDDLCAYLDWAALRPITEMEYEKICRGGPAPDVPGEYAWGSTTVVAGTTFSIAPENGTEVFSNAGANCTYNGITYVAGDGGTGPARVGIHAKPNSPSRQASGATFYGVMDMSGNVWEFVIMVSAPNGSASGSPTFDGALGDGALDWTTGKANVSTWPSANPAGFGLRGGSWADGDPNRLRISDRHCSNPGHGCVGSRNPSHREYHNGGRGAR